MESEKIKKILDTYWQGESTLEEETLLKSYFQGESIDPSLRPFQSLFTYFVDEKEISADIDWSFMEEKTQGTAKPSPAQAKQRRLVPSRRWLSVAASLLVIVSFFFLFQLSDDNNADADTFEDPEVALAQAKEALYFLTGKMDKATESAEEIKQLEKLGIFN